MVDYSYLFKSSNNIEEANVDSIFYNMKNLYLDLPLEKTNGYINSIFYGLSPHNLYWNGDKIQFLKNDAYSFFYDVSNLENINLSDWKFKNIQQPNLFYGTNITNLNFQNILIKDYDYIGFGTKKIKNANLYNWTFNNINYSTSYSLNFFYNCINLINVNVENWSFDSPLSANYWFNNCQNLKDINLSTWKDTNFFSGLKGFFDNCFNLEKVDLSKWNVETFEFFDGVFYNCTRLKDINFNNWNTCNLISLQNTFYSCLNLENLDLSNWNTSNLKYMSGAFYHCGENNTLKAINLWNWNFSQVIDMSKAFMGTNFITKNNVWNCPNLRNVHRAFSGSPLSNLPKIICNNLQDLSECFYGASLITDLDLSQWNISNTSSLNLEQLFYMASNLENVNIDGWSNKTQGGKLKNLYQTFMYTNKKWSNDAINEIQNFDTSSVGNFFRTFSHGYVADVLDLSNWNVAHASDFYCCFENWKGQKLIAQNWKFTPGYSPNFFGFIPRNASGKITEINLSNWNLNGVNLNLSGFFNATRFNWLDPNPCNYKIDVNNWTGLNGITSAQSAFYFCGNAVLDLSTWDLSNCSNVSSMFSGSYFIIEGMPNFNRNIPIDASYMFDNASVGGNIALRNICFKNLYNIFNNMGNPYRPIPISSIDLRDTTLSPFVTSLNQLFARKTGYFHNWEFLSNWNTSKVTNMGGIFSNLGSDEPFTYLWNWNTKSLTNIAYGFSYPRCSYINLRDWDITNVSSAAYTFTSGSVANWCSPVHTIDLSNWKSRYSSFNWTQCFFNCRNLKNIFLNSFKFNNSMNTIVSAFTNVPISCRIWVRDAAAKQFLQSKLGSSRTNIFIASPLTMDKVEPVTIMNTRSTNLAIEFYGGSTDIAEQNLSYNIALRNQNTIEVTSSINYTNSTINLSINTLQVGENNITITLSDTQGNTCVKEIPITITEYIPQFYEVEAISGAAYTFELNSNNYYESKNKGVSSSYAICKLKFRTDTGKLILDCINSGQSSYDYGILSTIDNTLILSSSADTTNVYKSFKGQSSYSVRTQTYTGLDTGDHFIYIKFIKNYGTNQGNDTLQFKVRFE